MTGKPISPLFCAKSGQTALVRRSFAQNRAGLLSFVTALRKIGADRSRLSQFCAKPGRTALVCHCRAQNRGRPLSFVAALRKTGLDPSRPSRVGAKSGRIAAFGEGLGRLLSAVISTDCPAVRRFGRGVSGCLLDELSGHNLCRARGFNEEVAPSFGTNPSEGFSESNAARCGVTSHVRLPSDTSRWG